MFISVIRYKSREKGDTNTTCQKKRLIPLIYFLSTSFPLNIRASEEVGRGVKEGEGEGGGGKEPFPCEGSSAAASFPRVHLGDRKLSTGGFEETSFLPQICLTPCLCLPLPLSHSSPPSFLAKPSLIPVWGHLSSTQIQLAL